MNILSENGGYLLETSHNVLFAYNSEIGSSADNNEIAKIKSEYNIEQGIIPLLCVANKALWKIGRGNHWEEFRLKISKAGQNDSQKQLAVDRLVWFVGLISTAVAIVYKQRLGLEPNTGVFAGIG